MMTRPQGAMMRHNIQLMRELISVILPVADANIPFIYKDPVPAHAYRCELKPLLAQTQWNSIGEVLRAMFRLRYIAAHSKLDQFFASPEKGTVNGVVVPDISLMQIIIRNAMQEMFISDDCVEKLAPLIDRRRVG